MKMKDDEYWTRAFNLRRYLWELFEHSPELAVGALAQSIVAIEMRVEELEKK